MDRPATFGQLALALVLATMVVILILTSYSLAVKP